MERIIRRYIEELKGILDRLPIEKIAQAAEMILAAHRKGGTIFIVGNGGSAATASHMQCDLGKGTVVKGKPRLRVLSLTDNVSHITALGNDISYDSVFVEQLKNLMLPNDLLIAISASGNSPNILKAADYARQMECKIIAFTGFGGGKLAAMADLAIVADSNNYGPVEDVHLILDHILREVIYAEFTGE